MKKKNVRVLGLGDNVVDMYEHTHTMYPGGNCVNFSVYAKLNGAETAAYMGYFGNDQAGEFVMDCLGKMEVDISQCIVLEGENGYSKVALIDGDRVFGDFNEGGIRGKTPFVLDADQLDYIGGFDLVHSGNYSFMESQLGKIREAGVAVSFDFSDDSTEAYYRQVAPLVDYAFCSFDGEDQAVRKHLEWVYNLGPELVCASRGAKGCILYDGNIFYEQPAVPLTQVVDTMGAGDSLLTSFLVHYLALKKENLPHEEAVMQAIQAAAAYAAEVCQMDGAWGFGKPYSD